jgi:hypothetical protein
LNEAESSPNVSDAATSAANAGVIADIVDRLEASGRNAIAVATLMRATLCGQSLPTPSDATAVAVTQPGWKLVFELQQTILQQNRQIAERRRQYPVQTRRMRPLKECIPPRTATGNGISYQAAWKWCTAQNSKVYSEPRGGRIWVDKVSFDAQLRVKGIEPLPD